MTREEVDSDTVDTEITSGGSATLEVKTSRARDVVVYVDDGTTGGTPASYSLTVDAEHDEYNDYHRQESITSGTNNYHEFPANGRNMQVTITDTSSTAATRRVLVKSYRDLD